MGSLNCGRKCTGKNYRALRHTNGRPSFSLSTTSSCGRHPKLVILKSTRPKDRNPCLDLVYVGKDVFSSWFFVKRLSQCLDVQLSVTIWGANGVASGQH